MSWNGHTVIDLDAHIRERIDRFYGDYIDPTYREPYQRLCEAIAAQARAGEPYALVGRRTAIIEPIETGRPLGVRDTFGLSPAKVKRARLASESPSQTDRGVREHGTNFERGRRLA